MKLQATSYKLKPNSGFTLIELLVVIAIISLLSSIILASLGQAREKAKIAKVREELTQMRTAMYLFLDDKKELPPVYDGTSGGDNCTACVGAPAPPFICADGILPGGWPVVMGELIPAAGTKYVASPIILDPWGNTFCYDDNYKDPNNCTEATVLWSMGPNGVSNTPQVPNSTAGFLGDDIGIFIYNPEC